MDPDFNLHFSVHDNIPAEEGRLVDSGLEESNAQAAPLEQVHSLACFARLSSGAVIGGAVGRTGGSCCELQQVWVAPEHRRRGVASELVRRFEARALSRGCRTFYLETFSFQAPALYESMGYEVKHEIRGYGPGIIKYTMAREARADETAG